MRFAQQVVQELGEAPGCIRADGHLPQLSGRFASPHEREQLGCLHYAWQNCLRDVIENFKGAQETDYHHALDWIFRVIAGIVKAGEGIFNTCDEMNGQLMKTPIYLFDLFCSVARHSLFFIQLFTVPMHFRMHRSQKQFRRLVTSD